MTPDKVDRQELEGMSYGDKMALAHRMVAKRIQERWEELLDDTATEVCEELGLDSFKDALEITGNFYGLMSDLYD